MIRPDEHIRIAPFDPEAVRTTASQLRWFHQIDLGHGTVTPGPDPSQRKLDALHLPRDMTGMRVIDIGAWDGFFSFACERRGADVLATDYHCWTLEEQLYSKAGFDFAKRVLGSKVKEKTILVEDIGPESVDGLYDVVLFLGVLYHSADPLGYLKRVKSVTKGYAVIESHVDLLDIDRPALAYYPGDTLNKDPTNFFGPNESAVHGMCLDVGFSRVETVDRSYLGPTRMVFHAYA